MFYGSKWILMVLNFLFVSFHIPHSTTTLAALNYEHYTLASPFLIIVDHSPMYESVSQKRWLSLHARGQT